MFIVVYLLRLLCLVSRWNVWLFRVIGVWFLKVVLLLCIFCIWLM